MPHDEAHVLAIAARHLASAGHTSQALPFRLISKNFRNDVNSHIWRTMNSQKAQQTLDRMFSWEAIRSYKDDARTEAWLTTIVSRLREKGADVNHEPKRSRERHPQLRTLLMRATSMGATIAVKVLVAAGADVNKKDIWKGARRTPLMVAAAIGYTAIARILIDHGADVNVRERVTYPGTGQTALIFAAKMGHLEIVRMLLQAGADKYVRTVDGLTALDLARIKLEMAERFVDPSDSDYSDSDSDYSDSDSYYSRKRIKQMREIVDMLRN